MSIPRLQPPPVIASLAFTMLAGCSALGAVPFEPVPPHQDISAACVETLQRTDGRGTRTSTRAYDADGRIVMLRGHLRYAAPMWERFSYDESGRFAEARAFELIPREDPQCDVEGGCMTPARQMSTVTRAERGSGGEIRGWSTQEITREANAGVFQVTRNETRSERFRYRDGRLIQRGDWHYVYEGGRLAALRHEHEYPQAVSLRYQEDRIASAERTRCSPEGACEIETRWAFHYDPDGRLVRVEQENLREDMSVRAVVMAYRYYDSSRLLSVSRTVRYPAATQERTRAYAYDEAGRMASSSRDGRIVTEHQYAGECQRVSNAPAAPTAASIIGAEVCVRSAGFGHRECLP